MELAWAILTVAIAAVVAVCCFILFASTVWQHVAAVLEKKGIIRKGKETESMSSKFDDFDGEIGPAGALGDDRARKSFAERAEASLGSEDPEPRAHRKRRRPTRKVVFGAAAAILAGVVGVNCVYTQDVGEAVVVRNLGGSVAGHTTEAGFHLKAPWQKAITWDIRNRQINFYRDSAYAYHGGSYQGSEVSINDASGTKANIDVQVIYSLDADDVEDLYAEYGTQEAFVSNYVSNDLRATAREVAGSYDTITLLTDRAKLTEAIEKALAEQWRGNGVIVEQVQVQDIRYADSITDAYADAQSAEVARQKALNAQETAKVEAETKKIEAQGEADANAVLTQSLTPEVLQQRYIDALKEIGKEGNLVVVPEGSQPIVGATK